MLDRIQNTNLDLVGQSKNLDKVSSLGVSNPYEKEDLKNFFIDESQISIDAMGKYQKEIDIKTFSDILKQTDEKEANELVLKNVFSGKFSINDDAFLSALIDNDDFLNDILNEFN